MTGSAAYPTPAQRAHPMYCPRQARRTPMIPFHNGMVTWRWAQPDGTVTVQRIPCTACGKVAD